MSMPDTQRNEEEDLPWALPHILVVDDNRDLADSLTMFHGNVALAVNWDYHAVRLLAGSEGIRMITDFFQKK